MFKKHKYKLLALLLVVLVAGGGLAYHFKKQKEKKEKDAALKAAETRAKEPLLNAPPVEKAQEVPKDELAIKTKPSKEKPLTVAQR